MQGGPPSALLTDADSEHDAVAEVMQWLNDSSTGNSDDGSEDSDDGSVPGQWQIYWAVPRVDFYMDIDGLHAHGNFVVVQPACGLPACRW